MTKLVVGESESLVAVGVKDPVVVGSKLPTIVGATLGRVGDDDGTLLARITGDSDGNSLVETPLGDELGGSETTSSDNVNGITIWDPSLKS